MDPNKKIIDSWQRNAQAWGRAVRDQSIESRRLVTDAAIVEAVLSCPGKTLLDIGCGEGWLARRLAEQGRVPTGVDITSALVDQAQQAGGGRFVAMSYADLAAGELEQRFDLAVCNFSLLGEISVVELLRAMPVLLNPDGLLLIQTLHPLSACGELPYVDGWREGSWQGFSEAFTDPAPWYFRTLQSWMDLLTDSGLSVQRMLEPLHPATQRPASVIFIASLGDGAEAY